MASSSAKRNRTGPRPRRFEHRTDPVLEQVQAWTAAKDARDALILRWQDAEHRLSVKIRTLKLGFEEATRGNLPEAKAMRSMMRSIKSADRALDRSAAQIALMRSTTSLGALAKIEMALRIQEPSRLEQRAFSLLQSGALQLREQLTEAGR